jgi:hypothetical protein
MFIDQMSIQQLILPTRNKKQVHLEMPWLSGADLGEISRAF